MLFMNVVPKKIVQFKLPNKKRLNRDLAIFRRYFNPEFYGLGNINENTPHLYIGNHTIYGFIDSPLIFNGLYQHKNVLLRSMVDTLHFKIPFWGRLLTKYGALVGTRDNCDALMQAGEDILVYPGGAREVAKRKGELYTLTWKERTGFVRMAIEHGYNIMPFASLGADEVYSILYDGDEFKRSFVGRKLLKTKFINSNLRGGDTFMPLVRGLGLSVIPRPEKFYFMFGKPISTKEYAGRGGDERVLFELRDKVADSVESILEELKEIREKDKTSLLRRLLIKKKATLNN